MIFLLAGLVLIVILYVLWIRRQELKHRNIQRVVIAIFIVVVAIILLSFATGCKNREVTPETTYPQTAIQTLDETSACKAAIGYAAVQVIPKMSNEESVDHDARVTEIIRYFDEQGSFPDECNAYHLSEMRPWIGYAGNLVWFCDTIDSNAVVDTSQMLGNRSLVDWLNEYLIPCPIPD